jgi:hypothetical protein
MSLKLGKKFNRSYEIRLPFLDGYYDIKIFFDKRSSFLLFGVDKEFENSQSIVNTKVSMFKNLESSNFCEVFIKLHNFRKSTLDISNQFSGIRPEYTGDISFILNETIKLAKIAGDEKDFFDLLSVYALTMNIHSNEFIFLIAERQHVNQKLKKKVVRTTGVQIATAASLKTLNEYYIERNLGKEGTEIRFVPQDAVIKLED